MKTRVVDIIFALVFSLLAAGCFIFTVKNMMLLFYGIMFLVVARRLWMCVNTSKRKTIQPSNVNVG